MTEVFFIPSREARVIPKGWRHPEEHGKPVPVRPEDMPEVAGLRDTEVAAYETGSEGTPISPPFPNTPQGRLALAAYCAEHCTTWGYERSGVEGWAAILFGRGAAVSADGVVIAQDDA